jgi:hypothetical protein
MFDRVAGHAHRVVLAKEPLPHRCWRAPLPFTRIVVLLLTGVLLTACSSSPSSVSAKPSSASSVSTTKVPPRTITTPPSTIPPSVGTRQVTYEPFTAQGEIDPTLRVTETVDGTCVAAGVAGNSSYRCFAQPSGGIYDPCFAPPVATSDPLLCPSANPASPDVVQFDVGSLPSALQGAPEDRPWAMQLSNGQVCVLVDAAWGGLGPFGCQSATPDPLADCHVPLQAAPWWTTACQSQENNASPFATYQVDTVWL